MGPCGGKQGAFSYLRGRTDRLTGLKAHELGEGQDENEGRFWEDRFVSYEVCGWWHHSPRGTPGKGAWLAWRTEERVRLSGGWFSELSRVPDSGGGGGGVVVRCGVGGRAM